MKRLLSLFLALALLVTGIPMSASATGTQSDLDTGDTQIEGKNDFGNLLADEIQTEYENEQNQGGFSILDITVEGNTAVVEYSAVEEALLMVGIYEEGWKANSMTNSGKTVVSPDATEATVTIEGEMPEYFAVSAYLMDPEEYTPLCDSFESPMYTYEMQELLDSTVDDYDSDYVLNFDESKETNFAVYSWETYRIEEEANKNKLTVDEVTNTYVFENADDMVMEMYEDAVFSYTYENGDLVIAKVGSIDIDGTTVTIQGAEVELQEVFSHVKIEEDAGVEEVEVDTSSMDEGIAYDGKIEDTPSTYNLRSLGQRDINGSLEKELAFDLRAEKDDAKVAGSINIDITLTFEYYSADEQTYVSLRTDVEEDLSILLSGETDLIEKRLGKWKFPLAMGSVTVVCEPRFKISFEAETTFTGSLSFTKGFTYDDKNGIKDISSNPVLSSKFSVEGVLFIGIDLAPGVEALGSVLVDIEAEIPIGVEITAELSYVIAETEKALERHSCNRCLDIGVDFVTGLNVELEFLKCVTIEENIVSFKSHLCDMYYSGDHDKFGMGECPYKEYLITVKVLDKHNTSAVNASISVNNEQVGETDLLGKYEVYLKEGNYELLATPYNELAGKTAKKQVKITEPCLVTLKLKGEDEEDAIPGILGDLDAGDFEDNVNIKNGSCGENVSWTLDSETGTLRIYGTGAMKDYEMFGSIEPPWYSVERPEEGWDLMKYCDPIKSIIIEEGVTHVGAYAFFGCWKVESVQIASTVKDFGEGAFHGCEPLKSVTIPDGVTNIPYSLFYGCGLKQVKIPDSVTYIGERAFAYCELEELILPDNIVKIDDEAFECCGNVTQIQLPKNIKEIQDRAFYDVPINSITIPPSVKTMGLSVFSESVKDIYITDAVAWCRIKFDRFGWGEGRTLLDNPDVSLYLNGDLVTDFVIPSDIEEIKEGLFFGYDKLKSVTIHPKVRSIYTGAFEKCQNLEEVHISDIVSWCSIYFESETANPLNNGANLYLKNELVTDLVTDDYTTRYEYIYDIDDYAFTGCTSLKSIVIGGKVGYVDPDAFTNCNNLEKVVFEENDDIRVGNAFTNCTNLKEIVFYCDKPDFNEDYWGAAYTFENVTATLYYPADNETWDDFTAEGLGGTLTLVPYTLDENGEIVPIEASARTVQSSNQNGLKEENISIDMPTSNAVHGGYYNSEYEYHTASFENLVPGEPYVMLALKDLKASDPLASDNLIYIDQKTADEDGKLFFEYNQLEEVEISYVIACGKSNKNLNNAIITFAEMEPTEESQIVDITVEYDGETLEFGKDYTLVGQVSFTEEGEYTCFVKGIGQYTGLVECSYKVGELGIPGDVNGDQTVDTSDAQAIFNHFMGISTLDDSVLSLADVNGDNSIDTSDAQMVFNMFMGIL